MTSLVDAISQLKKAANDLTKIGQLRPAQQVITCALDLQQLLTNLQETVLSLDSIEMGLLANNDFAGAVDKYRRRIPGITLPEAKKAVANATNDFLKKVQVQVFPSAPADQ